MNPNLRPTALLLLTSFMALPGIARAQVDAALTTAEISRMSVRATVTVLALGAQRDTIGLGSGFLVRDDGVVVTNWHVLQGAHAAIVITAAGEQYEGVQYLDGDEALDVALIKVPGYRLPTLVSSTTLPAAGERIVVIGSPLGLSKTVSEGIVSATRLWRGRELMQMSAPISPGSSGGPVLDERGRVVAIATSFLEAGQQLNFAIPVRYALGLLQENAPLRDLASVFGHGLHRRPDDAPVHADEGVLEPREIARRLGTPSAWTSRPRESLSGAFDVSMVTHVYRRDGYPGYFYLANGSLYIGSDGGGLGWATRVDMPRDTFVTAVQARWTPDGRVTVRAYSAAYTGAMDGFQTDAGFWVAADREQVDDEHDWIGIMRAIATYPRLSEVNGVYSIEARTTYRSGGRLGSGTDWLGDAVVVVIGGEVSMIVSLENEVRGTTGGLFQGQIADGRVRLETNDGRLRFSGTIEGGRLLGDWVDMRDRGARFEGRLRGERR